MDKHLPSCSAYEADDDDSIAGETKEARAARASKRKRNDSFQIFDPGAASETVKRPPGTGVVLPGGGTGKNRTTSGGPSSTDPDDGTSSTRFVEDLAALHVQAFTDPDVKDLLQEEITVRGIGTGTLADLFRPLERGRIGANNYIWFGGARIKLYGKGFRLTFYDRVEGQIVVTYISPEQMQGYRYRASLEETIRLSEDCRYVRAYIWGTIAPSEKEGQVTLTPERLQHMAIILGPPRAVVEAG